jgi:hypothetical protein
MAAARAAMERFSVPVTPGRCGADNYGDRITVTVHLIEFHRPLQISRRERIKCTVTVIRHDGDGEAVTPDKCFALLVALAPWG